MLIYCQSVILSSFTHVRACKTHEHTDGHPLKVSRICAKYILLNAKLAKQTLFHIFLVLYDFVAISYQNYTQKSIKLNSLLKGLTNVCLNIVSLNDYCSLPEYVVLLSVCFIVLPHPWVFLYGLCVLMFPLHLCGLCYYQSVLL